MWTVLPLPETDLDRTYDIFVAIDKNKLANVLKLFWILDKKVIIWIFLADQDSWIRVSELQYFDPDVCGPTGSRSIINFADPDPFINKKKK